MREHHRTGIGGHTGLPPDGRVRRAGSIRSSSMSVRPAVKPVGRQMHLFGDDRCTNPLRPGTAAGARRRLCARSHSSLLQKVDAARSGA